MVDVVFVVDDSKTMGPLQQQLAVSAGAFLEQLDVRGVDWRVGVVTTDVEDPSRRGRVVAPVLSVDDSDAADLRAALVVGTSGSQYEAGLSAMWSAVTAPLATHDNAGLRRDGARLAVVVVSDEDDCSDEGRFGLEGPESCVTRPHELVPVTDYLNRLHSIVDAPSDVSVHAVVEPGQTENTAGCGGNSPGTRYLELARATGGAVIPLCEPGATVMAQLGEAAAGRRAAFPLSRTPDPLTIDVRVGEPVAEGDVPILTCGVDAAPGTVIPEDLTRVEGWSYDPDANTVRTHGTAVPAFGAQIRICYDAL